jgi:hypothetical protein
VRTMLSFIDVLPVRPPRGFLLLRRAVCKKAVVSDGI